MPSYNSEEFIEESIKSVINQEYKNWELIISDDNSTDKTIQIVESIQATDLRIKFLKSKKNRGPAVARNSAIKRAKGRYIAFLDSDDLWSKDKLSKQIKFMKDENVALCYGRYNSIDEQGNVLNKAPRLPSKIDYNSLLCNQVIGCLTAVYDSNLCGKVYMPLIKKRQDFGLWLKLLKKVGYAHCCDSVIGTYRVRKNSVSSNKFVAVYYTWKLFTEVEHLSPIKAGYCIVAYVLQKIIRTWKARYS